DARAGVYQQGRDAGCRRYAVGQPLQLGACGCCSRRCRLTAGAVRLRDAVACGQDIVPADPEIASMAVACQMESAVSPVQTLTRYKAWADEAFLSVIAALPEAELVAPRPIYFGSLIRTLNHSFSMDFVWQCHLLGRPHGLTTRNPADHPAIRDLVASQRGIDAWYVDYADSL